MSKYASTFQELEIWIEAQDIAVEIYQITKDWRDWGLRDQLQRAIVSVSSNIAEGFDRSSHAEFKRFLNISRASLSESM
jgi:four helix bundle protein